MGQYSISGCKVRRVAIIGAGPVGIGAAKYFIAEKCFETIDIFEQQASFGGVWNYSECDTKNRDEVPLVNPVQPLDKPTWINEPGNGPRPVFSTPMYERLDTNIPKRLMQYSDTPFPEHCQLFPSREVVSQYIEEYARDVRPLVQFKTQVLEIILQTSDSEPDTWTVKRQNLVSGRETSSSYDVVAVCSGNSTIPYAPEIPGIVAWSHAYPGSLSHSKFYRRPEGYTNKKVIVVGNSASGIDIASQLATVCKTPVLITSRSKSVLLSDCTGSQDLTEIVEFLSPSKNTRAVRFADGRIETEVDAVLFCTGYLYSFPFLPSLQLRLIGDGFCIHGLYQHLFYIKHPSLAFFGMTKRILPFPMSEAQGAVVARVWSRRLQLPTVEAMTEWERNRITEKGGGKGFNRLDYPEDLDYHNDLYDWANQTDRDSGKMPRRWSIEDRWIRERFPAIQKAFRELGELRHDIRTEKQLGFDYDAWLKEEQNGHAA